MRFTSYCLLFVLLVSSCRNEDSKRVDASQEVLYTSDLETTVGDKDELEFKTTDPSFNLAGGNMQSSDYARSGNSCIRLDSENQYGLNGRLESLKEGEHIEITVWQLCIPNNDGTLQVSLKDEDGEKQYFRTFLPIDQPEGEWIRHYLCFTVGPGIEFADFVIFSGRKVAYFDDISIKRRPGLPLADSIEQLNLLVPDSSSEQLLIYIDEAAAGAIIPASSKKYVSAQILLNADTANIEMKLKGDWKDHLYNGKESYRIKINGPLAFKGLKNFSIQHPETRGYLDEWIMHQMLDKEDVLTTDYGFLNVNKNGFNHGVYAYEEHFDKQLLESRNRREGPILKFDETSMWTVINGMNTSDNLAMFPYFEQSQVSVFKKNRTRKSQQLAKQFDEGKTLLTLFKEGHGNLSDIFDIDQLAKFYVLMEICGSNHGLTWHNRRFYFNPVTQKLEHIAYDILPFIYKRNFECRMRNRLLNLDGHDLRFEDVFDNAILFSTEFKARYLYYLKEKTNPEYLDALFKELEHEIAVNLAAIQTESVNYVFDKAIYFENADYLRKSIPELENLWNKVLNERQSVNRIQHIYEPRSDEMFFRDLSLNAYMAKKEGYYEVVAENYHLNEITLHGYRIKSDKNKVVLFDEPLVLKGYNNYPDKAIFKCFDKPKKIYFTVSNNPNLIVAKKITDWERPNHNTSRMLLESQFQLNAPFYKVQNKQVIFSGSITIDRLILIPEIYEVVILPGAQIEFKQGGGIIATNSFSAVGTEGNLIRIFCKDSSSNGITVLNGKYANFEYVSLEGLSNLNYEKWELTGAVSIYETPANIAHCTILENKSEDALNIVRSKFSISNLIISDTQSDGFDADFCTGSLSNSAFERTGNDCIDFSGSVVDINQINIRQSGDKGISGGEASTLTLTNITIDGAITGIAAKDASSIKGSKISIANAEYGCAAFRKKPEYNYANIDLKEVVVKNVGQKVLVEIGSVVSLNGVKHQGKEKLDIEALYARFE